MSDKVICDYIDEKFEELDEKLNAIMTKLDVKIDYDEPENIDYDEGSMN